MQDQIDSVKINMEAPVKKSSRSKQITSTLIKTLISAALIYWILKGANFEEIFKAIGTANFTLIALAFSLHFVGFYLSAWRWKILLKAQNIEPNLWYLIKSCIVAMFFNNILPSTVGGDTLRAYDSYRAGKSKSGAVAVIFVDRFLGLFALMVYALTAVFFAAPITSKIPYLYIFIMIGFFLMSLIIWIIFFPSQKLSNLIGRIKIPFSKKLQNILEKIINAFWAFKGQKKVLLRAAGLSFLLQANVVTYYFLIALSLDFSVPYYNFFLIVPLSIFIMMLPISINGIGLRENAFFFFLAAFSIAKPDAIAFAWIEYGILLLQGVFGGIIYAIRR